MSPCSPLKVRANQEAFFTVGEVDTVHQKRIQEIESRNGELDGLIASATERVRVPDEMRDLEHECHLIPQAGGDCLTAINFYEDARELLEKIVSSHGGFNSDSQHQRL